MSVGDWHGDHADTRVSDGERDAVIEQLRHHLSDGRLTVDEFSDRVSEVYAARTVAELETTLRQLPATPGAATPTLEVSMVTGTTRPPKRGWLREAFARFAFPNIVCITIWAMTGRGYFWPEWVLFGTGVFLVKRLLHGDSGPDEPAAIEAKAGSVHDHHRHDHRQRHATVHEPPRPPRVDRTTSPPPPADRPDVPLEQPNGTDARPVSPGHDRVFTTIVYSDIVESTSRLASMGDLEWRRLLDDHERLVARELATWGGRKLFTRGDEVVAAFDGPARAVRCAWAIRDASRTLGLDTRSGVHSGEVERRGDDVTGIAMHIGQRVVAAAAAGEILVSSTVRDVVAGSGLVFEDRGEHELKGVPDPWRLYAVVADLAASV